MKELPAVSNVWTEKYGAQSILLIASIMGMAEPEDFCSPWEKKIDYIILFKINQAQILENVNINKKEPNIRRIIKNRPEWK